MLVLGVGFRCRISSRCRSFQCVRCPVLLTCTVSVARQHPLAEGVKGGLKGLTQQSAFVGNGTVQMCHTNVIERPDTKRRQVFLEIKWAAMSRIRHPPDRVWNTPSKCQYRLPSFERRAVFSKSPALTYISCPPAESTPTTTAFGNHLATFDTQMPDPQPKSSALSSLGPPTRGLMTAQCNGNSSSARPPLPL